MLNSYKELRAWQAGFKLCGAVYRITDKYPTIEKFGLVTQMRRASVSIPSNIAEGYGRKTRAEYIHSLYIANGSLCELETQLLLSKDFRFISDSAFQTVTQLLGDTDRLLKALINALKNK